MTLVKIIIEQKNQEGEDKSYTFLKTAKNLKIDVPDDFSSNLDNYLYGETDNNK